MKKIIFIAWMLLYPLSMQVHAQAPSAPTPPSTPTPPATPAPKPAPSSPQYGCNSPQSRQFDFWIGDWEYTSEGKRGINRVSKILDGCVILEQFGDGSPNTLTGHSVSTFDRPTRQWKQTWVDNTGSYLDFSGAMEGGKMVFTREATADGKKILQRMVWFNIEQDRFSWSWDRSDDGGKTWKVLWPLEYKRIK
jgi:hypothetical protein